jgi:gamma-carbonic anhydrase
LESELLTPRVAYTLPFNGIWPRLAAEPHYCGSHVSLLGRIQLGERALLGAGAVIRADGHFVRIGDDFCLGALSTVHIAHDVYPTIVGDKAVVGWNAVVHACTVGDNCVIEDEVVVLDGSVVDDNVLIEARSTVFPRSKLKSGFAYAGSPAEPVRELAPGELDDRAAAIRAAVAQPSSPDENDGAGNGDSVPHTIFIARTARLAGGRELGARSGVFFGCQLDAHQARIAVGENTNVQDNTRIDASEGAVIIGPDTTIGHNVHLRACQIGRHALIGIGADVAAGTIVDDDVLLAAGAITAPQQRLESGWLWGGRPARPIAKLTDARRQAMRDIVQHYCGYGAAYRAAQERLPG